MTMDSSQAEVEYLASEIFQNGRVVTYKTLSRALNIHINQSKLSLSEFYEKNKSKLLAKFIITGANDDGPLIKLTDSDDQSLKTNLDLFTNKVNTIQIYSVSNKDTVIDNEQIVDHQLKFPIDSNKLDNYYRNGMIKGPELNPVKTVTIKQNYNPSTAVPTKKVSELDKGKEKEKEKEKSKGTGLTSSYVSRKGAGKTSSTPTTKSTTSLLSNYTSRKSENAKTTPTKRSAEPSISYQYKSRKTESKQPKERIIVSSHNEEDFDDEEQDENVQEDTKESKSEPTKTGATNIQNLFADEDWSDFEEDAPTKDEPIIVPEGASDEDTQSKEVSSQQAINTHTNVEPDSIESEKDTNTEKEDVPEMITEYDEDGYIITKKNTKQPSKPPTRTTSTLKRKAGSPAAPASSSKKSDNKSKNQSILKFFK
ncbi:DNA polymerase subunit Cdc27 [Scheffersomyces amazonensis]|uniref:DNA polymerase subunit Cdc27 n=1 Tax=Scheffersomyces amazonensis TaxID=1078765 RepID=UPI00315DE7A4